MESDDTHDPFMYNKVRENELPESGLNPNDKDFKKSKWFYDMPGVVHSAQVFIFIFVYFFIYFVIYSAI